MNTPALLVLHSHNNTIMCKSIFALISVTTKVHYLAYVVVSLQRGPSETFCGRLLDPAKIIDKFL